MTIDGKNDIKTQKLFNMIPVPIEMKQNAP